MGANGSKTQVHIHVEKPFYYVGDHVTGFVALHTEEPMTFNSINLKVTGIERCEWKETHGSGNNRHTETYKGKEYVFKNKMPMMLAGTLNPGDYQWPFSFQLPHNIPGSFNYASGSTKAGIQYKIKADCDQAGLLKPDFKKTIRIEVLEHSKAAGSPEPIRLAAEEPIAFMCCFNKGVVGLKVDGDCDQYLPGDTIALKAQVDNKSTTEIPCVEFRLYQRLNLTAKTMWGKRTKNLSSQRVFQREVIPGSPSGVAGPGMLSHYETKLHLDKQLEATCHSQVIHSTYELEVRAKTKCILSEVALKQPILLNDPQPAEVQPEVVPPQGWAPQVYPTFQFDVPALESYQRHYTSTPAAAPQQHLQMQPLQPPMAASTEAAASYNVTSLGDNCYHAYPEAGKMAIAPPLPGAPGTLYQG